MKKLKWKPVLLIVLCISLLSNFFLAIGYFNHRAMLHRIALKTYTYHIPMLKSVETSLKYWINHGGIPDNQMISSLDTALMQLNSNLVGIYEEYDYDAIKLKSFLSKFQFDFRNLVQGNGVISLTSDQKELLNNYYLSFVAINTVLTEEKSGEMAIKNVEEVGSLLESYSQEQIRPSSEIILITACSQGQYDVVVAMLDEGKDFFDTRVLEKAARAARRSDMEIYRLLEKYDSGATE